MDESIAAPLGVFPPHSGVKSFTTSLRSGNVPLLAQRRDDVSGAHLLGGEIQLSAEELRRGLTCPRMDTGFEQNQIGNARKLNVT